MKKLILSNTDSFATVYEPIGIDYNSIAYTFKLNDISIPNKQYNDYSTAVNIPRNKENDIMFSNLYKLDANLLNNVNYTAKLYYQLYSTGRLVQRGYCMVESINILRYTIRLYNEKGAIFHLLSTGNTINNDTNDTDVQLKNWNVDIGSVVINKDLIHNCWLRNHITVNMYDNITGTTMNIDAVTFVPTYQGVYKEFDNSIDYYVDANGIYVKNEEATQLYYDSNNAEWIRANRENITENTINVYNSALGGAFSADYRSYYQKPAISVKFMINYIVNYIKSAGYNVNLDPIIFSNANLYLDKLWVILANLKVIKDVNEVEITDPDGNPLDPTRYMTNMYGGGGITGWGQPNEASGTYYWWHRLVGGQSLNRPGGSTGIVMQPITITNQAYGNNAANITVEFEPNMLWSGKYETVQRWNQLDLGKVNIMMYIQGRTVVSTPNGLVIQESPDYNDVLVIQYQDKNGNWIDAARYSIGQNILGEPTPYEIYHADGGGAAGAPAENYMIGYNAFLDMDSDGDIISAKVFKGQPISINIPNDQPTISIRVRRSSSFYAAVTYSFTKIINNTENLYAPMYRAILKSQVPFNNNYDTQDSTHALYGYIRVNYTKIGDETGVRSGSVLNWSIITQSKITMYDILTNYCKMFGMYYDYDSDTNTLSILSRNNYYTDEVVDITNKVLRDGVWEVQPISYNYRYGVFDNNESNSSIEVDYKTSTAVPYGIKKYDTNYPLNDNEIDALNRNIFNKCILTRGTGYVYNGRQSISSTDNKELPYMQDNASNSSNADFTPVFILDSYRYCDNNDFGTVPYIISDDDTHQRMYGYMRYDYNSIANNSDIYWNNNTLRDTIYPNMRDIVPEYMFGIGYSLIFGVPGTIFGDQTVVPEYTIYNKFWLNYISDRFSKYTKILTASVLIDDNFIKDCFRKLYIIDNVGFVLNSISKFKYGNPSDYICEFISVNDYNNYTKGQIFIPDEMLIQIYSIEDNSTVVLSSLNVGGVYTLHFKDNNVSQNIKYSEIGSNLVIGQLTDTSGNTYTYATLDPNNKQIVISGNIPNNDYYIQCSINSIGDVFGNINIIVGLRYTLNAYYIWDVNGTRLNPNEILLNGVTLLQSQILKTDTISYTQSGVSDRVAYVGKLEQPDTAYLDILMPNTNGTLVDNENGYANELMVFMYDPNHCVLKNVDSRVTGFSFDMMQIPIGTNTQIPIPNDGSVYSIMFNTNDCTMSWFGGTNTSAITMFNNGYSLTSLIGSDYSGSFIFVSGAIQFSKSNMSSSGLRNYYNGFIFDNGTSQTSVSANNSSPYTVTITGINGCVNNGQIYVQYSAFGTTNLPITLSGQTTSTGQTYSFYPNPILSDPYLDGAINKPLNGNLYINANWLPDNGVILNSGARYTGVISNNNNYIRTTVSTYGFISGTFSQGIQTVMRWFTTSGTIRDMSGYISIPQLNTNNGIQFEATVGDADINDTTLGGQGVIIFCYGDPSTGNETFINMNGWVVYNREWDSMIRIATVTTTQGQVLYGLDAGDYYRAGWRYDLSQTTWSNIPGYGENISLIRIS